VAGEEKRKKERRKNVAEKILLLKHPVFNTGKLLKASPVRPQ
jgi:hypothetical protein